MESVQGCYARQMRVLVALVGAALVTAAFACGSTRPPVAELNSGDAGESAGDSGGVSDGSPDGPNGESTKTCYDESEAKPAEDCKCNIVVVGNISTILPCGWAVCSSGTNTEGICTNIGTIVYVPGCPPLDPDASVGTGGGFRLPPCDAGTRSPVDGGADADADIDADAF